MGAGLFHSVIISVSSCEFCLVYSVGHVLVMPSILSIYQQVSGFIVTESSAGLGGSAGCCDMLCVIHLLSLTASSLVSQHDKYFRAEPLPPLELRKNQELAEGYPTLLLQPYEYPHLITCLGPD